MYFFHFKKQFNSYFCWRWSNMTCMPLPGGITHLSPRGGQWQTSFIFSCKETWQEQGRKGRRQSLRTGKQYRTTYPITQTGKSGWFFYLSCLCLPAPTCRKEQPAEELHHCRPGSGTKQSPTLLCVSVVLACVCAVQGWAFSAGRMGFLSVSVKPA